MPCKWVTTSVRGLPRHPVTSGPSRKGRPGDTVESHLEAGKTRAIFQIGYACDPPNVNKARTMIVENLKKCRPPRYPGRTPQAKTLLRSEDLLSESRVSGIGERLL